MALTNAERQRRYRQKLKARASGDALGDRARDAAERAVHALWAYHERPAPAGGRWSDIDGCTTLDLYRAEMQRARDNLLDACRAFLPNFEGLTSEEARALRTVIDIAEALQLLPEADDDSSIAA
jgi:hypothetical protein